jgi:hypothetical protein
MNPLSKIKRLFANISTLYKNNHTAILIAVLFVCGGIVYWALHNSPIPVNVKVNDQLEAQRIELETIRHRQNDILLDQAREIEKAKAAYEVVKVELEKVSDQLTQIKKLYGKNNPAIDALDSNGLQRAFAALER